MTSTLRALALWGTIGLSCLFMPEPLMASSCNGLFDIFNSSSWEFLNDGTRARYVLRENSSGETVTHRVIQKMDAMGDWETIADYQTD